jgi:NAD(P)-dependent dehydrogenase (short-subunit alcohol dehydrogenase family)
MTSYDLIAITGVTRGLGSVLTEWLIAQGKTIAGCARSQAGIDALGGRFASPHSFQALDVTSAEDVKQWARSVIESNGSPDLVICNASICNDASRRSWELSDDEFDRVIAVNIGGTANVCRAFLPSMVERGTGTLIGLSSRAGRKGLANLAPYCAGKFAIEGFMKSVARDLPEGMASIPMNPGDINTDMYRSNWPDNAPNKPSPEEWVEIAGPFVPSLGSKDNGESVTVPLPGYVL